jgi:predicted AAA+ superfamily ATPase
LADNRESDQNVEIIGRGSERAILRQCLESNRPEFVAVYGRRRAGKTFLIREVLKKNIVFSFTGSEKNGKTGQLSNFRAAAAEIDTRYDMPWNPSHCVNARAC